MLINGNSQIRATEFSLTDQYGTTRTYCFPRTKPSVLIFADQSGASQIEDWVRPLYQRHQESIDIDGIAVLPGIPSLLHGLARTIARSQISYPIMLDWDGSVAGNYSFEPERVNLMVIDPQGLILLRVIGGMNYSDLDKIYAALNKIDQVRTG